MIDIRFASDHDEQMQQRYDLAAALSLDTLAGETCPACQGDISDHMLEARGSVREPMPEWGLEGDDDYHEALYNHVALYGRDEYQVYVPVCPEMTRGLA